MAGKVGKTTRAVDRASVNIMKALDRARGSLADIPLGETRYDARTEKKRQQENQPDLEMEDTLNRLLHEQKLGVNR